MSVRVERGERGVVTVMIDRPEVRNALDAATIGALGDRFRALAADPGCRVVVVTGGGEVFCAGADLNWMRDTVDASFDETVADSRQLDAMLRAVRDCPKPVVARVNGHALGGGAGVVACADVAVAARGAMFGFTEVRLGLAPAVISPYVVTRIGAGHARHLFLTGERVDADTAVRIGLVHAVAEPDGLDTAVGRVVGDLLAGGPGAQAAVKELLAQLPAARDPDDAAALTTSAIARLRTSEEGQEGMRAFLEKRAPSWRA